MTEALLIIDIQNDYFPGGAMELVGSVEAGAVASTIQSHFREQGRAVINVQHIQTDADASFFREGTSGADIHVSMTPAPGEPHIVKHYPNAFRETDLDSLLRGLGVTDLVVIGMMTHMCVDTTVRAACDAGYSVRLVADACATLDLSYGGVSVPAASVQASYLAAIDGTFADVITSAQLGTH